MLFFAVGGLKGATRSGSWASGEDLSGEGGQGGLAGLSKRGLKRPLSDTLRDFFGAGLALVRGRGLSLGDMVGFLAMLWKSSKQPQK